MSSTTTTWNTTLAAYSSTRTTVSCVMVSWQHTWWERRSGCTVTRSIRNYTLFDISLMCCSTQHPLSFCWSNGLLLTPTDQNSTQLLWLSQLLASATMINTWWCLIYSRRCAESFIWSIYLIYPHQHPREWPHFTDLKTEVQRNCPRS